MDINLHADFLDGISRIEWLSKCGEDFENEISYPIRPISKWSDAEKNFKKGVWKNTTLTARNFLSGFFASQYRSEFDKWNDIVGDAKQFMSTDVYPHLYRVRDSNDLDQSFVHTVEWSVLNAIMEDAYRDCNPPVDFFNQLLEIYKIGHFPCGWEGGDWPAGNLIVF